MKTALGILTGLALCIGSALVPQFGTQAIAQEQGCCKVRESLTSEVWDDKTFSTLTEDNCKQFNEQKDGDGDHTQKVGYVWWDPKCEKS